MDQKMYRDNIIAEINDKLMEGNKRISVVSAVGSGRSIVASKLIQDLSVTNKILVVFSSVLIKEQFADRLRQYQTDDRDNNIELINIQRIYSRNKQSNQTLSFNEYDYLILYDLKVRERSNSFTLLDSFLGTVISFGILSQNTLIEDKPLDHRFNAGKIKGIDADHGSFDPMNITFINQKSYMVFTTEHILDVRDVTIASVTEKKKILEQVIEKKDQLKKLEIENRKLIEKYEKEKSEKEAEIKAKNAELANKDALIKSLEELISKMKEAKNEISDLNDFLIQVCNAVGIPEDILKKSYEKFSNLRRSYKSILNSEDIINNDENEKTYKKFQDEIVNIIFKLTKDYRNNLVRDNYENVLRIDFGEETWNKLSNKSKMFLITSKMTYDSMAMMENSTDLDFSGVCLLVTKALETEMAIRIYEKYINYLQTNQPISCWPKCTLNKWNNGPMNYEDFTLGSVLYFIGMYPDGHIVQINHVEHPEYKAMFDLYAKTELFKNNISDEQRQNKLIKCIETIEKVRKDYRNPSAHRDSLHITEALECWNYVVEVEKRLRLILEDYRF